MEIFVDFGLFEIAAALGFTSLAKVLYARRWLGITTVAVSVVIPITLLVLIRDEVTRWLAAANLGCAAVNATVALQELKRRFPNK